jgi:hypothetical protein
MMRLSGKIPTQPASDLKTTGEKSIFLEALNATPKENCFPDNTSKERILQRKLFSATVDYSL